jgi:hypothetical protein
MSNCKEVHDGEAYDQIRCDLLICHQNRTWECIRSTITIQIATIATWYYTAFEKDLHLLSALIVIFSIAITSTLKQSALRYSYLMSTASHSLNKNKRIYHSYHGNIEHSKKNGTEIIKNLYLLSLLSNIALIIISLSFFVIDIHQIQQHYIWLIK